MRQSVTRTVLFACLVLSGCNCGESAQTGQPIDGGPGSGADGSHPLGGPGAGCTAATDCMATLVCDPMMMTCGTGTTHCTSNAMCGSAALCTGGTCVQNTPGGTCDNSMACVPGELCAGGHCVPAGCGNSLYMAQRVPPNLLLVMDRSCSMNDQIGSGASRDTKWNIARAATHNLVTSYMNQIFFGLSVFPGTEQMCMQDPPRCAPGVVNVPVGPMKEAAITAFLGGSSTCQGGTPLSEELHSLISYTGLADTMRPDYMLLITDGMPTCNMDPTAEVTANFRRTPPVKTFVVGFGSGVDRNQLADMARAGGTARTGNPAYYQADDAASLRAAFAAIAGAVISCNYSLSTTPPDPNMLYVYFNGMLIPQDAQNGWQYSAGANQLVFHGSSCMRLQGGGVGQLVVVYGCPLQPGQGGDDGGIPGGGTDSGIPGNPDPNGPCSTCGECGSGQGCIVPAGQSSGMCGACTTDFQCCLGFKCLGGMCSPGF